MFCKKCGTQMEDGTKFCNKCGTSVEMTKGMAVKGSAPSSKFGVCALVVLILELVQLLLHFAPTLKVSLLGSSEIYNVANGLAESGVMDINMKVINIFTVIMSVLAMFFTVLNVMKINKGTIVGLIVRFISWGNTSFWFVGVWAIFNQLSKELSSYSFRVRNTSWGNIYHLVNTALFIMMIVLFVQNLKESKQAK